MLDNYHDKYPPFDMKTSSAKQIAAEKAAVFALISKEENMEKTKKIRISRKLPAVIAACAAAVAGLTVTVGAFCEWDYGKLISGFFPRAVTENIEGADVPSNAIPELVNDAAAKLDGLMRPVPSENVTSTFTNYDVRLNGVICDGSAALISAEFRKNDGSPFTEDETLGYSTWLYSEELNVSSERLSLSGDGTMRADFYCTDVNGITSADIEIRYLMNADVLKMPRDISSVDPELIFDSGVLSAAVDLSAAEKFADFTLTNKSGDTVDIHITPISAEVSFRPLQFSEDEMVALMNTVFYDKDGSVIFNGSRDIAGGSGDETGELKGHGYHFILFAKPIDPSEISAVECGEYVFGKALG